MDVIEFIKERDRMCNTCDSCMRCPLDQFNNCEEITEKIANAVEKWARENPIKTNLDKVKELFPNVKFVVMEEHGCDLVDCPPGTNQDCFNCSHNNFWNQPYAGTPAPTSDMLIH